MLAATRRPGKPCFDGSGRDHDLADMRVGFKEAMRLDDPVEREAGRDQRVERAPGVVLHRRCEGIAAAGITPAQAGLVLGLYGASALVGVTLGGRGNDHFGARRVQAIALPVMAASFAAMTFAALALAPHALAALVPLVVLWGMSAWGFFPAQQSRLIDVAGLAHTPVILSLNASFMYLGFAVGAGLGSIIITLFGIAWIGLAGAACVIGGVGLSRIAWRKSATASA